MKEGTTEQDCSGLKTTPTFRRHAEKQPVKKSEKNPKRVDI